MKLAIERTWQGDALPKAHCAELEVVRSGELLLVTATSPFFGDAPPLTAAGALDGLAQFEVVELFLSGPGEDYLEIELGPHGHHFVLELRGIRAPVRTCLPIEYAVQLERSDVPDAEGVLGRWSAQARVPVAYLPAQVTRANAYAIHGPAGARCHHAHAPVPGARPDFHRPEYFVPCQL